ncbi:hypothetical protein D2E71_21830 [Mycobacteroides abscessus]|nr:hypothetical protein MAUC22_14880 [Mycobacteroides abscessus UC22]KPG28807.1 hypothetical protein AN913_13030 [Mycobacteroides immunogenum]RIR30612.1 hypothetical protein D2E38_22470 [Mycobacteroides abscessus]KPG60366.1 hypothetical protein AN918_12010 [Mycobacteroides immunogenum]RIR39914.1 hypothetical protein D2E36_14200 [Mycobacteroides abscessus]
MSLRVLTIGHEMVHSDTSVGSNCWTKLTPGRGYAAAVNATGGREPRTPAIDIHASLPGAGSALAFGSATQLVAVASTSATAQPAARAAHLLPRRELADLMASPRSRISAFQRAQNTQMPLLIRWHHTR